MKYSRSVVSRTFYIRPLFFRVNLHYQYQYKVCLIIIRYYCQILQELSTRSIQKFSKTKKSSVSQQKHEYDKIIYLAENSVVAFRQRVADKCELFCSRTLYLLYCKRIKKIQTISINRIQTHYYTTIFQIKLVQVINIIECLLSCIHGLSWILVVFYVKPWGYLYFRLV